MRRSPHALPKREAEERRWPRGPLALDVDDGVTRFISLSISHDTQAWLSHDIYQCAGDAIPRHRCLRIYSRMNFMRER